MPSQEAVTETKVETVKSVHEEIIKLAERRVIALSKLDELNGELSDTKDKAKSVKNDINAVDRLFKEKFDKLSELKNGGKQHVQERI
jgi:hypothetical protein